MSWFWTAGADKDLRAFLEDAHIYPLVVAGMLDASWTAIVTEDNLETSRCSKSVIARHLGQEINKVIILTCEHTHRTRLSHVCQWRWNVRLRWMCRLRGASSESPSAVHVMVAHWRSVWSTPKDLLINLLCLFRTHSIERFPVQCPSSVSRDEPAAPVTGSSLVHGGNMCFGCLEWK